MLAFPNAKINIGLRITSKRPDGYHNIESCFYPIPWADALEIVKADKFKFTTTGLEIPGASDNNLCIQAYQLLQKDFDLAPVHIHLHKVIPMGAGLGGGSADGSFTLKTLNELFELSLTTEQLQNYAGRLGSDCPFFIENKPVVVRGTGDEFSDCSIQLNGKYLLILNPGIHIGTKEAYANVKPKAPDCPIEKIITGSMNAWKHDLSNDFEESVFPRHPEIKAIKEELYQLGAIYASMTGSGSTVYGIFDKLPASVHRFKILILTT
ncbi:4-(cytidine 5'-diphospho)-2-C-methyl-D-erythritol kinase [Marinoscillum sp.]|uniref:4-(cytidine 5'-diphospho)-2-C-methyl-D-erythritol kinase n=1 Tax=Marinoscillum sp. TaxID=2024838 RepID=UPI003BAC2E15